MDRADLNLRFGFLLAGERRRKRFSQAEFAAELNRSRASIANIERGVQTVTLQFVYDAARILGIDVARLLPSEGDLDGSHTPHSVEAEQFIREVEKKMKS